MKPVHFALAILMVVIWGLAFVFTKIGLDSFSPLALIMISPISFAAGNLILRRAGQANAFNVIAWGSLVPPLPCFALALWMEGPAALGRSLAEATWLGWFSAVYLGLIATSIAYVIWGDLLRHYSSAVVAPFALLVPFVGAGASYVVFSERFGPMRLAGMALVLLGLAFVLIPAPWLLRSNLYRTRG